VGLWDRLYAGLGRFYPLSYIGIVWLTAMGLATVFLVSVVFMYVRMPWGQGARVVALALAGLTVGIAAIAAMLRREARPVYSWIAGERDEKTARDAWAAATSMPGRLAKRAYPLIVFSVMPANLYFNLHSRLAGVVSAAIFVGVLLLVGLGIALDQAILAAQARPIIAEIDAAFPGSGLHVEERTSSLFRRVVVAVLLVVPTSAWLTTALTARIDDPGAQIGFTVVAGFGVAITFSLVLVIALSQSFVQPVSDLVAATRRVADGDLTARVPLVSNDELGQLAKGFNEMTAGLAERAALHSALGTYLDPLVADRLLAEGQYLKGEAIDVTVMFVDIVGFTTRAERMDPETVVAELNLFFEIVVPVIDRHEGHTNKLLGDGLMAVFGTPIPVEDHADRAVAAACEIVERVLHTYGDDLRIGIGINTGTATVGTTGGGRKLDYTVIGDTVNVASRVEALTRTTGDTILLTDSTRVALSGSHSLAPRGWEAIRGRTERTQLHSVRPRSRG
jgi:adenylate cyclase